jgi:5-methylcytosine-specific restriction endonuclease McrA
MRLLLPPVTIPPSSPIERDHVPRPAKVWRAYRDCLRWDFAFTCAFCLLHDADFFGEAGGEGLAVTTAEHIVPRSTSPERAADYENLAYACRLCNTSRSNRPNSHERGSLLDPSKNTWAEHFEARDDRLVCRANDSDALYTEDLYDLNDPRKVERRELRRRLLTDRLRLIQDFPVHLRKLQEIADRLLEEGWLEEFAQQVSAIAHVTAQARQIMEDAERFAALPLDRPSSCRCPEPPDYCLPAWLLEQTSTSDAGI